jgi:hypothetical protein
MLRALLHTFLLCLAPGTGWLFLSAFSSTPTPLVRHPDVPVLVPTGPGASPHYPLYPFLPPLLPPPVALPSPAPAAEEGPEASGRDWQVPRWIVAGILAQETRSVLRPDDSVRYVDKRRGAAGERGPTQIRRIAFDQVMKPGEAFWKVEVDVDFALDITERYLLWLRKHAGSWERAIRAYNVGLEKSGWAGSSYYADVRRLGGR